MLLIVDPVNSDVAENGKLEQVLSNRGFVCLVGVSGRRSRAALQIEILALRHQLKFLPARLAATLQIVIVVDQTDAAELLSIHPDTSA